MALRGNNEGFHLETSKLHLELSAALKASWMHTPTALTYRELLPFISGCESPLRVFRNSRPYLSPRVAQYCTARQT